MTILNFIKKHPVLSFFVLTFVISWGGLLFLMGGPSEITNIQEQFEKLLPFAILALLAGPSITGILMTALVDGRKGLQNLLARLLRWRAGVRWYVISLFGAPLLMIAIFLVLSLFSPKFLPGIFVSNSKASFLIFGILTGLAAGVFEELGWTGFATPKLRKRYGVFSTGLIVGLLWAVWHLLAALWFGFASGTVSGTLSLLSYLMDPFLFLLAFRLIIVWAYEHTGSLLIAMVMHLSLTASARIITPSGIVGAYLLAFGLVWAVVVWAVIAVLALKRI